MNRTEKADMADNIHSEAREPMNQDISSGEHCERSSSNTNWNQAIEYINRLEINPKNPIKVDETRALHQVASNLNRKSKTECSSDSNKQNSMNESLRMDANNRTEIDEEIHWDQLDSNLKHDSSIEFKGSNEKSSSAEILQNRTVEGKQDLLNQIALDLSVESRISSDITSSWECILQNEKTSEHIPLSNDSNDDLELEKKCKIIEDGNQLSNEAKVGDLNSAHSPKMESIKSPDVCDAHIRNTGNKDGNNMDVAQIENINVSENSQLGLSAPQKITSTRLQDEALSTSLTNETGWDARFIVSGKEKKERGTHEFQESGWEIDNDPNGLRNRAESSGWDSGEIQVDNQPNESSWRSWDDSVAALETLDSSQDPQHYTHELEVRGSHERKTVGWDDSDSSYRDGRRNEKTHTQKARKRNNDRNDQSGRQRYGGTRNNQTPIAQRIPENESKPASRNGEITEIGWDECGESGGPNPWACTENDNVWDFEGHQSYDMPHQYDSNSALGKVKRKDKTNQKSLPPESSDGDGLHWDNRWGYVHPSRSSLWSQNESNSRAKEKPRKQTQDSRSLSDSKEWQSDWPCEDPQESWNSGPQTIGEHYNIRSRSPAVYQSHSPSRPVFHRKPPKNPMALSRYASIVGITPQSAIKVSVNNSRRREYERTQICVFFQHGKCISKTCQFKHEITEQKHGGSIQSSEFVVENDTVSRSRDMSSIGNHVPIRISRRSDPKNVRNDFPFAARSGQSVEENFFARPRPYGGYLKEHMETSSRQHKDFARGWYPDLPNEFLRQHSDDGRESTHLRHHFDVGNDSSCSPNNAERDYGRFAPSHQYADAGNESAGSSSQSRSLVQKDVDAFIRAGGCTLLAKTGQCRFGKRCKFSHDI